MARLSRRSLGLVLIFATAGIWIVTSIVSASLVTPGSSGTAAVHPFLLTYLATSLFTLYLPLLHFQAWWTEERHAANRCAVGKGSDMPPFFSFTCTAGSRLVSL